MNKVKAVQKITEAELKAGISGAGSWHSKYKDSVYVYVGGLPYGLTEGDVICMFSQFGEIFDCNLVRDKVTGKSKGFAFVGYEDQRSTVLAVDNFNGVKVLQQTIRVDHVDDYRPVKKDTGEKDERGKKVMEVVGPNAMKWTESAEIGVAVRAEAKSVQQPTAAPGKHKPAAWEWKPEGDAAAAGKAAEAGKEADSAAAGAKHHRHHHHHHHHKQQQGEGKEGHRKRKHKHKHGDPDKPKGAGTASAGSTGAAAVGSTAAGQAAAGSVQQPMDVVAAATKPSGAQVRPAAGAAVQASASGDVVGQKAPTIAGSPAGAGAGADAVKRPRSASGGSRSEGSSSGSESGSEDDGVGCREIRGGVRGESAVTSQAASMPTGSAQAVEHAAAPEPPGPVPASVVNARGEARTDKAADPAGRETAAGQPRDASRGRSPVRADDRSRSPPRGRDRSPRISSERGAGRRGDVDRLRRDRSQQRRYYSPDRRGHSGDRRGRSPDRGRSRSRSPVRQRGRSRSRSPDRRSPVRTGKGYGRDSRSRSRSRSPSRRRS